MFKKLRYFTYYVFHSDQVGFRHSDSCAVGPSTSTDERNNSQLTTINQRREKQQIAIARNILLVANLFVQIY